MLPPDDGDGMVLQGHLEGLTKERVATHRCAVLVLLVLILLVMVLLVMVLLLFPWGCTVGGGGVIVLGGRG